MPARTARVIITAITFRREIRVFLRAPYRLRPNGSRWPITWPTPIVVCSKLGRNEHENFVRPGLRVVGRWQKPAIFHGVKAAKPSQESFSGAARRMRGAMLKIWGRTNSSNVQKVLWTCADLGIP